MFGYIKPLTPELKVKENEAYRGIYCGLCKRLGSVYGPFVRMTLSYDFVFLALLLIGLKEEPVQFQREHCIIHPFKRRNVCQKNESLDHAAAAATILLYYKLLDNFQDEGLGEKFLCMLAMPFAKKAYRKAEARLPHLAKVAKEQIANQSALEKAKCPSVDQASEPTGKILEAVLEGLTDDPIRKEALKRMGYLLGRWVYLIDALDDLDDDIKHDNYNPFRYMPQDEPVQEQAVGSLYMTIAEITRAYELLDIRLFQGILSNIVELGLKNSVDKIRQKRAGIN